MFQCTLVPDSRLGTPVCTNCLLVCIQETNRISPCPYSLRYLRHPRKYARDLLGYSSLKAHAPPSCSKARVNAFHSKHMNLGPDSWQISFSGTNVVTSSSCAAVSHLNHEYILKLIQRLRTALRNLGVTLRWCNLDCCIRCRYRSSGTLSTSVTTTCFPFTFVGMSRYH